MPFHTVLAAAVAASFLAAPALAAPATVRTAQGELAGVAAGPVVSFKGVPFAAPPVGDLRWRPPAPPARWPGVRDASVYGPSCIQTNGQPPGAGQSEDCLTLNIWKPAEAASGARLPVMVWIFGGAFRTGAGANPSFDGTEFARRGVVLVTINYRLGRLGNFAHPALTAEAAGGPVSNYGVMDAMAALKWAQDNIAAFGGDPANVTLFGESAGAETVNILMAVPSARGLFHKAIAQSGFGRLKAVPVRGEGERYGVAFAASVGVSATGPEAMRALRALTPAQIVAAPDAVAGQPGARPMRPMIDGVVVVETPEQAFAAGREHKVPYIAGNNSYEASLNPDIARTPEPTLARAGAFRDRLVALYGGDPGKAAYDFVTESAHSEPTRYLARQHVRNGQKAWVYYASYVPAEERGQVHGLTHGGEIRYVFGTLNREPVQRGGRMVPAATAADWAMSRTMADYWTAFAKTSDPGSAGGPAWPAFDPRTDALMEFGADGAQARTHFHKDSLDLIEQINLAAGGAR